MKKLYLHIGIEKTGTSAIQRFLAINSQELLKNDFLYPEIGRWHDKSHHGIAFSITQNNLWDKSIVNVEIMLEKVLEEFNASKASNLIISTEVLRRYYLNDNFEIFKQWVSKNFDELHLIIYLREQISWLSSMYNQLIKDPNVRYYKGVDEFIDEYKVMADFYSLLTSWELALKGIEYQIHAISYQPKDQSVLNDFLNVLDVDKNNFNDDEHSSVNPSLKRPAFDLIRHFNKYEIDNRKKFNSKVVSVFDENSVPAVSGEYSILSYDLNIRLKNYFNNSNKRLLNSYSVFLDLKKVASCDFVAYNGVTVKNISTLVVELARSKEIS